jgi:hypothetical protein
MFFLLRIAFWLGIVLMLLPTGSEQHGAPANEVTASAAVTAASATVQDLRGFCGRQPDACSVGSEVAVAIGYKAQAGAKMLYEFLHEALASRGSGSSSPVAAMPHRGADGTAGTPPIRSSLVGSSQNTLNPADLTAPWHGPQTRKDAKPAV